ncbi:MAG: hypothetical protein IIV90_00645, partial [Oscillospiraceae bacterium]|nr:hypothetical protein [Oscillospiraceae bacterium]
MLSAKQAKRREEWRRALPLLRQGAAALAGAALAGGEVFGLYPLGLAFVLGVPGKFLFAGAAGAAAGSLVFLPPTAALRMVGAVAAGFAGRALAPKSRWGGAAAGAACLLLVEGLLLAGGLSSLGQGLAAAGEAALALTVGLGLAWGGAAPARGALLWVGAFVPALESLAPGHGGFLLAGAAGLALAYRGEVKNAAAAAICWGGALAACGPELLPTAVALMA